MKYPNNSRRIIPNTIVNIVNSFLFITIKLLLDLNSFYFNSVSILLNIFIMLVVGGNSEG